MPVAAPEKKSVLGSNITCASRNAVLEVILAMAHANVSAMVCLTNVHMLIEAFDHEGFRRVLQESDMALPDGKPVGLAMNLLYGTRQERIPGPDLMVSLLACAEREGLPVFFYGATDEVLDAIRDRLAREHPELLLAGTISPPFRPLSDAEDEAMTEAICRSGARLVMVGLGCPKQELWMAAHRGRIPAVLLGVGAAFPFYAGHLRRCPVWMQEIGLEWLYRLIREPKRLFKRYFYTNTKFLFLLLQQLIRKQLSICPKRHHSGNMQDA